MSDPTSATGEWLIKRNCSAGPGQLAIVFGSMVAISFAFGIAFAAFGFWMVLPFVGLEVIAVAAAFFCYGRHAADFERIAVAPNTLSVDQIDGPRANHWEFDPRVARVQTESHGRLWGKTVRVYLLALDTRLELGRYLLEHRRMEFARELEGALMRARAEAH